MTGRIIVWLCMIWIAPLMSFLLCNETRFKKNIVVGVTLPQSAREDGEVLALLRRFRRWEWGICLGLLAVGLVCMLAPVSMGVTLLVSFLWVDVCVVLPVVPYARCNRALKELKSRRGWRPALWQSAGAVAELTVAAQPVEELPFSRFLWPLLVSLLPTVVDLVRGETLFALIMLMNPACVLLFYVLYRFAFRRKAEVVDEDSRRTAALTRLRRQYWRRCWLWGSWAMAAFALGMWLSQFQPVLGLGVVLLDALAMTIGALFLEFRLRRLQERLTADSGTGSYVDEDDKWLWGMFYYDPNDSRLIINARVGMNTTVNLARRAGRVIVGLTAALLLVLPLTGVWVIWEERSPITLTVAEDTLTARHAGTRYAIPLGEITDAVLLEERPVLSRVAGTALDTVDKGRYRAEGYGSVTACLDPREGPWLLVTTAEGKQYLLSATDPAETAAAWEAIR